MQEVYTKKCLKSLNTVSQEEAKEIVMDSNNSPNGELISNLLSVEDAGSLVSVHQILCTTQQTSLYYQWFPHRVQITDSQASALVLDETSKSKVIKLEVKTLTMQDSSKSQLLVISDVTQILRHEKKKMTSNF